MVQKSLIRKRKPQKVATSSSASNIGVSPSPKIARTPDFGSKTKENKNNNNNNTDSLGESDDEGKNEY